MASPARTGYGRKDTHFPTSDASTQPILADTDFSIHPLVGKVVGTPCHGADKDCDAVCRGERREVRGEARKRGGS